MFLPGQLVRVKPYYGTLVKHPTIFIKTPNNNNLMYDDFPVPLLVVYVEHQTNDRGTAMNPLLVVKCPEYRFSGPETKRITVLTSVGRILTSFCGYFDLIQ